MRVQICLVLYLVVLLVSVFVSADPGLVEKVKGAPQHLGQNRHLPRAGLDMEKWARSSNSKSVKNPDLPAARDACSDCLAACGPFCPSAVPSEECKKCMTNCAAFCSPGTS